MKAPRRKPTTRTSRHTVLRRCVTRLREPSTYASLAAIAAVGGLQIDESVWRDLSMAGAALAAVVGMVLPEGGNGK